MKQGFTNNPKEIVKTKFFTDYQIFDEIILVYTKSKVGVIVSEPIKRWYYKTKLSLKDLKEKEIIIIPVIFMEQILVLNTLVMVFLNI